MKPHPEFKLTTMQPESLVLRIVCFSMCCYSANTGNCLGKNVTVPRHFYVNNQELPFVLEVSVRQTHQLVSHIFKLLLTDVLGYKDVVFRGSSGFSREAIKRNAVKTLQKATGCSNPRNCTDTFKIPEVMINLEVWIVPSFNMDDWIRTRRIVDCGPLGPVGLSGWFVPQYSVQELWIANGTVLDHWRSLRDPKITALFDLTEGSDNMLSSFVFDTDGKDLFCTQCDEDGIYRPSQCLNKTYRCATLLVAYPEPDFELLKHEISDLGLLVNVAWVGDNLQDIIVRRLSDRKPVLFYHIKPSVLFSLAKFTRLAFPECEDGILTHCERHVFRMQKVAWSEIKSNAPHVYHLLKELSFSQNSYVELLNAYNEKLLHEVTVEDFACDWLKTSSSTWSKWLAPDVHMKTPLYIGGIFPKTGVFHKRANSIILASQLAIDAVNDNKTILSNYKLTLLQQDGHCISDEVVKSFINYVSNSTFTSMIGVLGPACSDTIEPIVGVAKHFNTIIISYSASGSVFSNSGRYTYFFRTAPEINQFRSVFSKLLQQLQWNRVAAFGEKNREQSEYLNHMAELMESKGIELVLHRRFQPGEITSDIRGYLKDAKAKNVRVIIGEFHDYMARIVMCTAFRLNMTAAQGYQWFLPLRYQADWYETDSRKQEIFDLIEEEYVPCTTEQMKQAIEGHLSLGFKAYGDPDSIMQENISIKNWLKHYQALGKKMPMYEASHYSGYAYDAVWAYAIAVNALFRENSSHLASLHTTHTSRRLAQLLSQTSFSGVSGRIQFTANTRLSEVVIWQWVEDSHHQIGIYRPLQPSDGELDLDLSKLARVLSAAQQHNEFTSSDCPFESFRIQLNVSCDVIIEVFAIVVVSLFMCLLVYGVFGLRRSFDKRICQTEARLKELGLTKSSMLLSPDQWEMRRDHIILNRRLGEGAFGTVYGGEAFIEGGWVSVAVKTLKVGAKPEEKLDFLSEAELMKKLNHINVIELIGVCTTKEPLYLVMEFMLYGDLKTYLLARRNLVPDPQRNANDEVSNRRLTDMAMDIARGLSYLAENRYVHRDLACRNCLVDAARTVKIADFGLCRPTYDSDYYRFKRTNMLPVRWMAPESLTNGLFTTMSDIWSYGVVLYEIITFGSLPYQCLSNEEVLKYVTSCNVLNIPSGCSQKLEDLLKRCWSRIPKERPQASEIVELLAIEPELICPCFYVPATSMEFDESEAFQVPKHEPISWLWRGKKNLVASSNTSANYSVSATVELKMSTFDTSHASYLYMASPDCCMKNQLNFSNVSQVTRL